MNHTTDELAGLSAHLLGLLMAECHVGSAIAEVKNAAMLHDSEKLYPRLTITAPHGGGGSIKLELVLCHPETDEARVSMLIVEAVANAAPEIH
jgi:hypothetical protein